MVFVKELRRNTIKSVTNSHQSIMLYCNTFLLGHEEHIYIHNENNFGKMKNIYAWQFNSALRK